MRRRARPGSACSPARAARARIESFDVDDLACQDRLPGPARRRLRRHASIPTSGWSPRTSARSTTSSSTRWPPPTQALRGCRLEARDRRGPDRDRRADRLRHRRHRRHRRRLDHAEREGPAARSRPFFIPGRLINLASGQVSIEHGLKGPNHAVVTACSTGAHAIGDAARLIALGDADVMVAGGAESPISRLSLAGFAACRALSTGFNDDADARLAALRQATATASSWARAPASSCSRSYEHAKARGAKIYAEVIGYGLSGDAYHITAPAEDGDGAYPLHAGGAEARRASTPSDIDYINAHGTSTPLGDEIELKAVERLRRQRRRRSSRCRRPSRRPGTARRRRRGRGDLLDPGHPRQIAPPTLNLDNPSRRDRRSTSCRTRRSKRDDRRRAVELLRLRRHQRVARLPALRALSERGPFATLGAASAVCATIRS